MIIKGRNGFLVFVRFIINILNTKKLKNVNFLWIKIIITNASIGGCYKKDVYKYFTRVHQQKIISLICFLSILIVNFVHFVY